MRRLSVAAAVVAFVATVYAANWLVQHVGPIRVWPTMLLAPAGVYVVGLAFVLRDYIQYQGSKALALAAIAVGTALSVLVSPALAFASACAFAASECVGLTAFWISQRRTISGAVLLAGLVAAALDSYIFLSLAFHSLAYFNGQLVAKLTMSVLAAPVVVAVRKATDGPRFGANGSARRAAVAVGEGCPARPKTRHARDWASTRSCAPFPRPEE